MAKSLTDTEVAALASRIIKNQPAPLPEDQKINHAYMDFVSSLGEAIAAYIRENVSDDFSSGEATVGAGDPMVDGEGNERDVFVGFHGDADSIELSRLFNGFDDEGELG